MSELPVSRVSAGILWDRAGRILIAQRPAGKHMAGWWEFPGGKAAEGESGAQALARELQEELGIRMGHCEHLLQIRHDYPDRIVELDVYVVADYEGEPRSLEGQALRWVATESLAAERLLPADRPILQALIRRRGEALAASAQ